MKKYPDILHLLLYVNVHVVSLQLSIVIACIYVFVCVAAVSRCVVCTHTLVVSVTDMLELLVLI